MIKFIITDLDETFWMKYGECPGDNVRLAKRLRRSGIPVIPCTGRSLQCAIDGAKRFGVVDALDWFPGVYNDGAVVYGDSRDQLIQGEFLTPADLDAIRQATCDIVSTQPAFTYRVPTMEISEDAEAYLACFGDNLNKWDKNVVSMHGDHLKLISTECTSVVFEHVDCIEIRDRLRQHEKTKRFNIIAYPAIRSVVIKPGGRPTHIGHKIAIPRLADVHKKSAIFKLCAHYGWDIREGLFLGDGVNDIELLHEMHSVAMCDGAPEAISAASSASRVPATKGGWACAITDLVGSSLLC